MPPSRQYDRHQVAKIVIEALDLGLPITATVSDLMQVTRQRAVHMIRGARADGLLGLGDHVPVRATIHRSSKHQQSWLVCEHCKTFWPCPPYITNQGTDTHDTPRRAGERSA